MVWGQELSRRCLKPSAKSFWMWQYATMAVMVSWMTRFILLSSPDPLCSLPIYPPSVRSRLCKTPSVCPKWWDTFHNLVALATMVFTGITLKPGQRYASLDGDADRVVYFFEDNGVSMHLSMLQLKWRLFVLIIGKFRLLDGDKISTLVRIIVSNLQHNVKWSTIER